MGGIVAISTLTLGERLRSVAASRGEEFLAEIPATLRRLRLLFVVLAISVPAFFVACLAGLAWLLFG
jgi:hypothetical protein